MSLIACTSACVHQRDGYCSLARADSAGLPCAHDPCVNFLPRPAAGSRPLQHRTERLPNISDSDKL